MKGKAQEQDKDQCNRAANIGPMMRSTPPINLTVLALCLGAACVLFARIGTSASYQPKGITGATDPTVTQATIGKTICVPNYTARARNVTEADKQFVLKRDGQTIKGCCEVDHLISLELGGSNDRNKNLWAEPYEGQYSAREKDKVETALHRAICRADNPIPLADAQKCIVSDWIACGRKIGAIQ
jgi:hypothetical protein